MAVAGKVPSVAMPMTAPLPFRLQPHGTTWAGPFTCRSLAGRAPGALAVPLNPAAAGSRLSVQFKDVPLLVYDEAEAGASRTALTA